MPDSSRIEHFVARFAFVVVIGGALASAILWMGVGVDPIPLHLRSANAISAYVSYLQLSIWPR